MKKWLKRVLIALLLLYLCFILVVIPAGLSWLITHIPKPPARPSVTYTRIDLNTVPFTRVQFPSRNSFKDSTRIILRGEYLPRDNATALVIFAHGLFRSREEVRERAALLWQRGYAGFIFDFRSHGKSDRGMTSAGYLEQLDVLAAIDFVRDSLGYSGKICNFGVSMGGAATLLAMPRSQDIAALVIDSSFRSFSHTVRRHLKLLRGNSALGFFIPQFPVAELIIMATEWRVGFSAEHDFDLVRAITSAPPRPTLFIAGGEDRRMPVEVVRELYNAEADPRRRFFVVENARHGAAFRTQPERYIDEMASFLDAVVGQEAEASR